jgi:hypothetical protein
MTAPAPDPVDTIERFAELSAQQDDPFADADAVLRAVGLDEDAWEIIERRWMERLASGGPGVEGLSERFGEVYAATRQRLSVGTLAGPVPDTLPTGAAFLSSEAQPWRAEAAEVGRHLAVEVPPLMATGGTTPPATVLPRVPASSCAETLESPTGLPIPALPFRGQVRSVGGATLEVSALLPATELPFPTAKP